MHLLLAVAAALAGAPASAPPAPPPPPPPCQSPEFHQWDFWLGSWRVTNPKGGFQGTSRVVSAAKGCAFEEHWTAGSGGEGESFNVYDPVRKTWTQLWTGGGSIIRLEGRLESPGHIRLQGALVNFTGGPEHAFTGDWTLQPDGTVKQEFHDQDPATHAWSTWFVGIYHRQS